MMCFTNEELTIILNALRAKELADYLAFGSGEINPVPVPERSLIDKIQIHLKASS